MRETGDKKCDDVAASDQFFVAGKPGRVSGQHRRPEWELLCCSPMRVLEARFHPHSKKRGSPVAVALVLCDQEETRVEPCELHLARLHPFDGDALMKKLTFLVESAKPRPYEQLTTLRSEFWSFADVAMADADTQG